MKNTLHSVEHGRSVSEIKPLFDRLYASRSPEHLSNDPLSFCHRFDDPADREVAAVIASSFAYGAVSVILRTLESIFSKLGPSPHRYAERFDPREGLRIFSGFKHRFNDARDLCTLLFVIRHMIEAKGSIGAFFAAGCDEYAPDVTVALDRYTESVMNLDFSAVFGTPSLPPDSRFPFFFPPPASGSACKRLCMFLRWMIRPSDGIDLGLWQFISPSRLIVPVDTHIARIARYLGFTRRTAASWRMAQEITAVLRRLDPEDPVKYDFVLAHRGISDGCGAARSRPCGTCPLATVCSSARSLL